VKYNKKEILRSLTPQKEETSTLAVDSKEEEEVWVEVEVKSFVITVHNHDIWLGTFKTLVPIGATATHLNMLLKTIPCC
jgi:hypothetical protein